MVVVSKRPKPSGCDPDSGITTPRGFESHRSPQTMKHYAIIEIHVEADETSFKTMEKLVEESLPMLIKRKASHLFDKIDIYTVEIGESE